MSNLKNKPSCRSLDDHDIILLRAITNIPLCLFGTQKLTAHLFLLGMFIFAFYNDLSWGNRCNYKDNYFLQNSSQKDICFQLITI